MIPRFVDAPVKYDAANERQFRNQLDQALQALSTKLSVKITPPTGGTVVDSESRTAVAALLKALGVS